MNSNLLILRDLLDDNNVGFCYSDLIEEIDDEIKELESEIDCLEHYNAEYEDHHYCESCGKLEEFENYIDSHDLHRDFQQLEAQHELKQISDESYLVAKSILEKYVTI